MTTVARRQASLRAGLFDSMPSEIAIIDRTLRLTDNNRACVEQHGEGREAPCFRVLRGRNTPCRDCPAPQVFAEGKPRVLETTGRDRQGRASHLLLQLIPLRDPKGDVSHLAELAIDLTASRQLQSEYQTLFEKVPCYVCVLNRDFRVVKANERFREVFGVAAGEPCHMVYKRRPMHCTNCAAEKVFADGVLRTAHHAGVTREGKPAYYIVSTAPLLYSGHEVTHVIQMALDVTELRAARQELDQAGRLREALVETSPDAIVVLDGSGKVFLFNRAAEALWGLARERVVGRAWRSSFLETSVADLYRGRRDNLEPTETRVVPRQGEPIPVVASGVTLRDEDGSVAGAALLLHDLRERKQLEKEKLEAERLAAVGQTVAGLAHGIKNILTGLEGGMYVTSTGLDRHDDARIRQGWGMLERNIGRISTLARDLLAFSRGEEAHPEIVDPSGLVAEVAQLYRDSARQHGVEIVVETEGPVRPASLDRKGVASCLENLVSNALDACLVSRRPSPRITLRAADRGDDLTFDVTDTGCGMDYDVKQKVFTSFFSTKGAGGTGIGLLLTRKIVQQHGGSVTFETTPEEGTTFRLRFPRARLPRPAPERDAPQPVVVEAGVRVGPTAGKE
jgi:PAS domain S-box-containing protein